MKTTVFKLGNSNAIRLSKTMMEALKLSTNDEVEIKIEDETLLITKKIKKITVEELFKDYNSNVQLEELDWGEDVGKEIIE